MRTRSMILATLFIVRLRRIVDGTLGLPADLDDLEDCPSDDSVGDQPSIGPAKRGPAERPASGSSTATSGSASSTRSLSRYFLLMPPPPPVPRGDQGKRRKG